jgi:hypothetical protein
LKTKTAGAKAQHNIVALSARLKSCPDATCCLKEIMQETKLTSKLTAARRVRSASGGSGERPKIRESFFVLQLEDLVGGAGEDASEDERQFEAGT